ncbi:zinc finger protein 516 [Sorex fumeus]|uniref:zinc finger protein 516 n=1 Tax=Sorex fumeus TaxID=62283 RepID=UPI0024ADD0AF|nr:zinc finger protein 516 [Sorex fumeus]
MERSGPEAADGEPEADRAASHSCCICGKGFPFQSSLSQHMRKHTGEKPYKCPYCDHRASQKGNLKIHIRGHRGGTLAQAQEPEAGEPRVAEGLGGCASPTKSTSACNRVLNGARVLLRGGGRREGEAGEERAAAQCAFCRSRFARRKELEQHVRQAHRPFRCRLCGYAAPRREALLSHVEKDHVAAAAAAGAQGPEPGKAEPPAGEFPCEVCGQAFSQTWFLKAHMKKHRGSFDHGCHICGRRFKEPWFLKNHMKAHGPRAAGRNRPRGELEPVATINDVVQEETIVAGLSLYEVCPKCGNLFTDLDSLSAHNAVHRRVEAGRTREGPDGAPPAAAPATPGSQRRFLQCLDLRPAGGAAPAPGPAGQRVAELDPVSSYQAWQLATRGKVAEPAEALKYGAWDEAPAGDVAFDRERREFVLVSQEKRRREREPEPGPQGPPRKRSGDPAPGAPEPRPAPRPSRRAAAPAGQGKSSECFECGKIFRTYHQMVLHSRVHRRARRHLPPRPGEPEPEPEHAAARGRCGSLSEGDSPPSSPGSPGSGLADDAAEEEESGEEAAAGPAPGPEPRHCCVSEEAAAPAALSNGAQSHPVGKSPAERDPREPRARTAPLPGSHGRDPCRRPEPPKTEAPGPREPCPDGARKPVAAPDLTPLDLSERSTRGGAGPREPASSLQAALAVHPCSYCGHKTHYPEVLWMHKRLWHRVSCHAVAPQWVPPNGHRGIRNHLVFLARSGRTGPPPALGGKECQPLPIARFSRTQVPAGAAGPKGSASAKASGPPRSKEGPWPAGPEGPRQQRKPSPAPEPPAAPPKPKAGPAPGSGVPRGAPSTPGVIARAGPPPPACGRPGEKFPPAPSGPPPKHSAPDPPKAKFSPQPQGQPHGKGDGGPALPPRESPSKAGGGGSRSKAAPAAAPLLRAVTEEPAAEGHEKRLDILSIFKTYIPKDFASLYQSWGASGPALEHRGERPF